LEFGGDQADELERLIGRILELVLFISWFPGNLTERGDFHGRNLADDRAEKPLKRAAI